MSSLSPAGRSPSSSPPHCRPCTRPDAPPPHGFFPLSRLPKHLHLFNLRGTPGTTWLSGGHGESGNDVLHLSAVGRRRRRRNGVYASLFGVGEALVTGVVALLVFGPKGLTEVTRNLGKTLRALQRTIRELQIVSRKQCLTPVRNSASVSAALNMQQSSTSQKQVSSSQGNDMALSGGSDVPVVATSESNSCTSEKAQPRDEAYFVPQTLRETRVNFGFNFVSWIGSGVLGNLVYTMER